MSFCLNIVTCKWPLINKDAFAPRL